MIYIVAIIIISCIIWNKINYKLYSDNLSPYNLLYFSWILPILLVFMQLSELESPWENKSIIVLIWVTISLIFTSLMPYFVKRNITSLNIDAIFNKTKSIFQEKWFKIFIIVLFILIFPLYIYSEFVTNPVGIPLLAVFQGRMDLIGDLHRWGKDTKWHIVTPILFILTPMLYMFFKSNGTNKSRYIYLILSMLYPVMGFLKLSRSDIFIGALNIAFIEYYYRKYNYNHRARRNNIIIRAMVLAICIIIIASSTLYTRTGMDAISNYYANAIGFKIENPTMITEILAQFYGYFALPYENFHRFFESYNGGINLGISALRPFYSIFGRGYVADEMIENIDYEPAGGAAGSATFITFIYGELGIYGLIFIPLLYGSIVNLLYLKFRHKPNFVNMFLYMNFVYPWVWLFFNNAFSVLSIYLNAIVIIIIFVSYKNIKKYCFCIRVN